MKFSRASLCLAVAVFLAFELGCGDQYRPVANPIPSPGGQPQNTYHAWVVSYNPSGPGSTTEIDVSGDSNQAVNTMGLGSISEAFPPSSLALFVANRDNDTVSEYLPTFATNITTISLLPGSRPVFLNSARPGYMFVLNSGANSACPNGGSVSTIPTSTLSVSATTCVGPNPTTMAQSGVNYFTYVINQDGTVSVVDAVNSIVTGLITTQNGGLTPGPVSATASPDGRFVFVVTQGDGVSPGALDIIGAGTAAVAATVPLGVQPTFSIADPVLNRLYVVNSGSNTVSVFDASNVNPSSPTPIPLLGTVTVGTNPIGLTPLADGSRFYVANAGSNDVTVVSSNSFSPLGAIQLPAGANPVYIASSPDASKVYVADPGISATTIIQTSNNTIPQSIPAPTQQAGCTSNCALQQPVMIVSQ